MNLTKQATLKLIVRNTGVGDAFNVRVDDELPDGLKFISSQPEMQVSGDGHHLSWLLNLLPGGSDRVITIKVQPTKTGPFDHAATVRFETGCKSRTTVLEPRLKVDIIANPTVGKVLKGQQVEFNVSIQNTGDGPARNVAIQAKLSPGLKHESGPKGDEPMVYELTLPELPAGATEKLDPLVADAILGGDAAVHCHSQQRRRRSQPRGSRERQEDRGGRAQAQAGARRPRSALHRYRGGLQDHARKPRDRAGPQGPRPGDPADQREAGQVPARGAFRQDDQQTLLDDRSDRPRPQSP